MTKAATDAARRLWVQNGGGVTSPEEIGAATQRVCDELRAGLSRWVGAEGYQALLDRALRLSVLEHPVLGGLSCHDGGARAAAEAAREHGAAELATGVVALVATVTELLGRIIGEEMAVQLVAQAGTPGERPGSSTDSRGGRNG